MKKYFLYQLKKSIIPFAVMVFAGMVIYIIPLLSSHYFLSRNVYSSSYYLLIGIVAACMLVPVWAFRYKMNRRSTDLYFSLPIKRDKLLAVHFISGYIAIVAAYTVVYWSGFIYIAINNYTEQAELQLINMLWMYLAVVVTTYITYSIYSFAFTRANNTIDGLFYIFFATFAVFMVALFFNMLIKTQENEYTVSVVKCGYYFPFDAIFEVFLIFIYKLRGYSGYPLSTVTLTNVNIGVSMGIFAALSVACTYGLFALERKNKSEDCEQNSDSIFGYKTMIPLIFGMFTTWATQALSPVLIAISVAAAFFTTVIWKRKFRIGKNALIMLIATIVCGIVLGAILHMFF